MKHPVFTYLPWRTGQGRKMIAFTLMSALTTAAQATVLFSTMPDPFPTGSALVRQSGSTFNGSFAPAIAVANLSTAAFTIDNVVKTESLMLSSMFDTTLYTDSSFTTVASTVSLPITFGVTLAGRTSPFQTGTFAATIT